MNKDIGKYGNKFTSDNQPANRGRKPKLYTIAKKSYGITLDEFKDVINYLWQLPKDEVKKIAEKDDTPIWMTNVCRSLYKDTAKGVMNTLRELIQLMFGKELTTKIDVTTNGKDMVAPPSVNVQVVTNDPNLLELQDKSVTLKQDEGE